jgi:hypothetical protein
MSPSACPAPLLAVLFVACASPATAKEGGYYKAPGSAAHCVGRACELPFDEQRDSEALSGFCGRNGGPDVSRVFVRQRSPTEPRVTIYWRVEAHTARATTAIGTPSIEAPGSHMMLTYTTPSSAEPPFAQHVQLTGFTLGLSFGWAAPPNVAGPRPRIALKVGQRLYGPYVAGAATYRAAIKLNPHPNHAVPETAINAADLAALSAQLAVGEPRTIILSDTAGRDIVQAPLEATSMAANIADAVAWTDSAAALLAHGRCPP